MREVVKMKDIVVFSLTSSIALADEICVHLGIKRGEISVKHFSDGEIIVEPLESVRGKHVFLVQSTCYPVSAGDGRNLPGLRDGWRRGST